MTSSDKDDDVDSLVEEEEVFSFGDEHSEDVSLETPIRRQPFNPGEHPITGPVFQKYGGEDYSTYLDEEGDDSTKQKWAGYVDIAIKGEFYEVSEPRPPAANLTHADEIDPQRPTTTNLVQDVVAVDGQKRSKLTGTFNKIKKMIKGKKAGPPVSDQQLTGPAQMEPLRQSALRNLSFAETKLGSMMLREEELQMLSRMGNDQADSGIGLEPDSNILDQIPSNESSWWSLSTLAQVKNSNPDSLSSSEGGSKKYNKNKDKKSRLSTLFQSSGTNRPPRSKLPTARNIDGSPDPDNEGFSSKAIDMANDSANASQNHIKTGKITNSLGKDTSEEARNRKGSAPELPTLRPEGVWRKMTDTISRRKVEREEADGISTLSYKSDNSDMRA